MGFLCVLMYANILGHAGLTIFFLQIKSGKLLHLRNLLTFAVSASVGFFGRTSALESRIYCIICALYELFFSRTIFFDLSSLVMVKSSSANQSSVCWTFLSYNEQLLMGGSFLWFFNLLHSLIKDHLSFSASKSSSGSTSLSKIGTLSKISSASKSAHDGPLRKSSVVNCGTGISSRIVITSSSGREVLLLAWSWFQKIHLNFLICFLRRMF